MAIDLKSGDRGISLKDGDLELITGVEEVAQNSTIRLQFVKGEYKNDLNVGTDWFFTLFSMRGTLEQKEAEIRRVIASTPGFKMFTDFRFSIDPTEKKARVDYIALTESDEEIRNEVII